MVALSETSRKRGLAGGSEHATLQSVGKRANGEGSVYQRKDGRWCARFTIHTTSGPKRKAFYGKTRKEASDKMLAAMGKPYDEAAHSVPNTTVGEWLASAKATVSPTPTSATHRSSNTTWSPLWAVSGFRGSQKLISRTSETLCSPVRLRRRSNTHSGCSLQRWAKPPLVE